MPARGFAGHVPHPLRPSARALPSARAPSRRRRHGLLRSRRSSDHVRLASCDSVNLCSCTSHLPPIAHRPFARFVASVWLLRSDTPVVRASGKELSFVLLAGILMCYLVTFALVLRPSDVVCSLQRWWFWWYLSWTKTLCVTSNQYCIFYRFGTGFCFTVVYAALLTKTNRIARIFDASKQSARRPSLISPKSQLLICSLLVSVQVYN